MSATSDRQTALTDTTPLRDQGIEGPVAKRAASPHRAGRSSAWQKIRHAETVDANVVGYTGPAARPRTLAVQLSNGRTTLTQKLAAPLAARIGPLLAAAGPGPTGRTSAGQPYTAIAHRMAAVEIATGTGTPS
ncbi:hypothetical protein [Streptomyces sp. NPDC088358]|uniref:hypothetical protein n=1 Tax=Streptomyces sp. NPDC088358 TaxID=3365857 RepID=UPI003812267A